MRLVQKLTENDVKIEMMEQKQENVEPLLFFNLSHERLKKVV